MVSNMISAFLLPAKIVLVEVTKPTKIVLIGVTKPIKIVLLEEQAVLVPFSVLNQLQMCVY